MPSLPAGAAPPREAIPLSPPSASPNMAATTSATGRPRTASRTRTDKKALLDALAEELKRARAEAELEAKRMIEVEDQVEAKHRQFLDEEIRLKAKRDANASTISNLRREIARARQALDNAAHVDEAEAEAYLDLIQSNGGSPFSSQHDPRPSVDQSYAIEGHTGRAIQSRGAHQPPIIAGYGFLAPASPPLTPGHHEAPGDRLETLADHVGPRERPTSPIRQQSRSPWQDGPAPSLPAPNSTMAATQSKPSVSPTQQGHDGALPPLGRRWSRVLNGLNLTRTTSRG